MGSFNTPLVSPVVLAAVSYPLSVANDLAILVALPRIRFGGLVVSLNQVYLIRCIVPVLNSPANYTSD